MSGLNTWIVDRLRNGKEKKALGPMVYDGRTGKPIVDEGLLKKVAEDLKPSDIRAKQMRDLGL